MYILPDKHNLTNIQEKEKKNAFLKGQVSGLKDKILLNGKFIPISQLSKNQRPKISSISSSREKDIGLSSRIPPVTEFNSPKNSERLQHSSKGIQFSNVRIIKSTRESMVRGLESAGISRHNSRSRVEELMKDNDKYPQRREGKRIMELNPNLKKKKSKRSPDLIKESNREHYKSQRSSKREIYLLSNNSSMQELTDLSLHSTSNLQTTAIIKSNKTVLSKFSPRSKMKSLEKSESNSRMLEDGQSKRNLNKEDLNKISERALFNNDRLFKLLQIKDPPTRIYDHERSNQLKILNKNLRFNSRNSSKVKYNNVSDNDPLNKHESVASRLLNTAKNIHKLDFDELTYKADISSLKSLERSLNMKNIKTREKKTIKKIKLQKQPNHRTNSIHKVFNAVVEERLNCKYTPKIQQNNNSTNSESLKSTTDAGSGQAKTNKSGDESTAFKLTMIRLKSKLGQLYEYYMNDLKDSLRGIHKPLNREFYQHFLNTTKQVILMKGVSIPKESSLTSKMVYLPPPKPGRTKTLILDLDETLVHCCRDQKAPADVKIPLTFTDEGDVIEVGICIRPGAHQFLEDVAKNYEVIIFTSSQPAYANRVLNILDPNNEFITYRAFREHCVMTDSGIIVKDLRIFANRDMKNLILVDNSILNYSFQLYNGVPILPYTSQKKDTQLQKLLKFLEFLKGEDDVRMVNKAVFKAHIFRLFAERPDIISRKLLAIVK